MYGTKNSVCGIKKSRGLAALTTVLNMIKTVVNLHDLAWPTKTHPDVSRLTHVYVCNSQQFITTITIVVNFGQNRDSVTGVVAYTLTVFSAQFRQAVIRHGRL